MTKTSISNIRFHGVISIVCVCPSSFSHPYLFVRFFEGGIDFWRWIQRLSGNPHCPQCRTLWWVTWTPVRLASAAVLHNGEIIDTRLHYGRHGGWVEPRVGQVLSAALEAVRTHRKWRIGGLPKRCTKKPPGFLKLVWENFTASNSTLCCCVHFQPQWVNIRLGAFVACYT